MKAVTGLPDDRRKYMNSASITGSKNVSNLTDHEKSDLVMKPELFRKGESDTKETYLGKKCSILPINSREVKKQLPLKEKNDANSIECNYRPASLLHSRSTRGSSKEGATHHVLRSTATTLPGRFPGSTRKGASSYAKGSDATLMRNDGVMGKTWGGEGQHPTVYSSTNGDRSRGVSVKDGTLVAGKRTGLSAVTKKEKGMPIPTSTCDLPVHSHERIVPSSSEGEVVDVTENALVQGSLDGKYMGTCFVTISVTLTPNSSFPSKYAAPPFLEIEDAKGALLCRTSLARTVLSQDPQRPVYVYVEGANGIQRGDVKRCTTIFHSPQCWNEEGREDKPQGPVSEMRRQWSLMFQGQEAVAHFFTSVATALASFYGLLPLPPNTENSVPTIKTLYHSPAPLKTSRGSNNSIHDSEEGRDMIGIRSVRGSTDCTSSGTRASAASEMRKERISLPSGTEVHYSYSLWKVENTYSTTAGARLGELIGEAPREAAKKLVLGSAGHPWLDQVFEEAMMDMTLGAVKIICFLPSFSLTPHSFLPFSSLSSSPAVPFHEQAHLVAWISCVSIAAAQSSSLLTEARVRSGDEGSRHSGPMGTAVAAPCPSPVLSDTTSPFSSDVVVRKEVTKAFTAVFSKGASSFSSVAENRLPTTTQSASSQPTQAFVSSHEADNVLFSLQSQIAALQHTFKQLCESKAASVPFSSSSASSPITPSLRSSDHDEGRNKQEGFRSRAKLIQKEWEGTCDNQDEDKRNSISRDASQLLDTTEGAPCKNEIPKTPIQSPSSSFASEAGSHYRDSTSFWLHSVPSWEAQAKHLYRDVYKEVKHQLLHDDSHRRKGHTMLSREQMQHVLHVVERSIKQKEIQFIEERKRQLTENGGNLATSKHLPLTIMSPRDSSYTSGFSNVLSCPNSQQSSVHTSFVSGHEPPCAGTAFSDLERGGGGVELPRWRGPLQQEGASPPHGVPSTIGRPPPSPVPLRGIGEISFEGRNMNLSTEREYLKEGERNAEVTAHRYHSGQRGESGRSSSGVPLSIFRSLGRTISNGNSGGLEFSHGGSSFLMCRSGVNSLKDDDELSGLANCSMISSILSTPVPRRAVLLGSQDFHGLSTPLELSQIRE